MEYSEQEIEELNNQLYKWQKTQKELMSCKRFRSVINEYGNIGKLIWDNIMKAKTFKDTDWVIWCTFDKFINIVKKEIIQPKEDFN